MPHETDIIYIKQAIELAQKGFRQRAGGPFGALIVKEGEVIGQSFNTVAATHDPTAHAEIAAMRNACKHLQARSLEGCTLYTSCEPCPMCYSAAHFAKIDRIVYAASHVDAGEIAGYGMKKLYAELSKPIEERQIQSLQLRREEGWVPFKEAVVFRKRLDERDAED